MTIRVMEVTRIVYLTSNGKSFDTLGEAQKEELEYQLRQIFPDTFLVQKIEHPFVYNDPITVLEFINLYYNDIFGIKLQLIPVREEEEEEKKGC